MAALNIAIRCPFASRHFDHVHSGALFVDERPYCLPREASRKHRVHVFGACSICFGGLTIVASGLRLWLRAPPTVTCGSTCHHWNGTRRCRWRGDDLHEEARRYKLTNIPNDRTRCIELLTAHLERNGPLRFHHSLHTAEGEAEQPAPPSPGSQRLIQSDQDFYTVRRGPPVTDDALSNLCTVLSEQLKLQNEAMRHQQLLLQQVLASLPINQGLMAKTSQPAASPSLASPQDQPQLREYMRAESFTTPAGNSVKFLSSQIPTFGATEEEDVELWLEKIESGAEIHKLSSVVMLSAAASKLAKSTRRWFDLSTGEVNRLWLCFRAAILDHFKKKFL